MNYDVVVLLSSRDYLATIAKAKRLQGSSFTENRRTVSQFMELCV